MAFFFIAGGLHSVTALRKTGGEETVYPKNQELKQASKQSPQAEHESLVATEAIFGARVVVDGRVLVSCLFPHPLSPRPPPRRRRRPVPLF